ncbi:MAG: hypothetical protein ACI9MC_004063, partial [Kiritimatiellia bacterium]
NYLDRGGPYSRFGQFGSSWLTLGQPSPLG